MKNHLRKIICAVITACMLVSLTAVNVSAAKPKLSKTSAEVPVGYSVTVTVKNASKVKWSSSDESVAEVKADGASAKITGRKTGTATVSAKVGSTTLKCAVTVKKAFITPSAENITVSKGKSKTITLKVNGSKDVALSNSNKDVCSASWGKWDGSAIKLTIKGKAEGSAVIKVYIKNDKKSTAQEINVTVEKKSEDDARIDDVFALVNEARRDEGVGELKMDDTLNEIADIRAKEIAEEFSHTRPDGSSCFTAFDDAGYKYMLVGENIGYEYKGTADSIMYGKKCWMNSPLHKANILNGEFTKIGVGVCKSGDRYYWVQVFAV